MVNSNEARYLNDDDKTPRFARVDKSSLGQFRFSGSLVGATDIYRNISTTNTSPLRNIPTVGKNGSPILGLGVSKLTGYDIDDEIVPKVILVNSSDGGI